MVADIQAGADGLLQGDGASVRAAANLAPGEQLEPAFDEVEPGSRGWGEVHDEPRVPGKPRLVFSDGTPRIARVSFSAYWDDLRNPFEFSSDATANTHKI